MKSIVKDNRLFFISIGTISLIGGVALFFYGKPDLIYFFNERRTNGLNTFFKYFTKLGEEPIYLLSALFFLTKKIRHAILIALIGFVVMGLSYGLKAFFAIDRPFAYFRKLNLLEEINFIEGVDVHSAATSFPSGHAMSAFALYSMIILLLPKRKRYVFPLLTIAVGVAVSRVYLVQHFYVDVYVGSVIGVLVAMLLFWINGKWRERLAKGVSHENINL